MRILLLLIGLCSACTGSDSTDFASGPQTATLPPLPDKTTAPDLPRATAVPARDLRIALSGEVRGELEPCGCPTLPYGGFTRRGTLLDRLRSDGPLLHLDAGDLMVKGFSTDRAGDLDRRAKAALRLSTVVGVDLWVPGPSDLFAVSPQKLATVKGPRRVSATLADKDGALLLEPSAVLTVGKLKVGIIGLSAKPADDFGLVHIDPVEAAKNALRSLPDDLDVVIGLGSIVDGEARRVATEVPGLSLVLTTRGAAYADPSPVTTATAKQAAVIEAPDRGRYLQLVHLRLGADAAQPVWMYPEATEWRARNAALRRGAETDRLEEVGKGRNLAHVSTIPLSSDLDQASAAEEALNQYKASALKAVAARAKVHTEDGPRYAASGACVNCHSAEFARWSLTGHANAWLSIVERDQKTNPECLSCHTTGWGEPSGLGELTPSAIRKFKGVQCEVCHGPMGGHPDGDTKPKAVREQTCLPCHDEANSPEFNYAVYLPQASCQGGTPHLVPRAP